MSPPEGIDLHHDPRDTFTPQAHQQYIPMMECMLAAPQAAAHLSTSSITSLHPLADLSCC